jgi:predicted  nucleic acid-binding Zn-ribbon protein
MSVDLEKQSLEVHVELGLLREERLRSDIRELFLKYERVDENYKNIQNILLELRTQKNSDNDANLVKETNLSRDLDDLKTKHEILKQTYHGLETELSDMRDKRNSQLLGWAGAIIASLISAIGLLVLKLLLPGFLK